MVEPMVRLGLAALLAAVLMTGPATAQGTGETAGGDAAEAIESDTLQTDTVETDVFDADVVEAGLAYAAEHCARCHALSMDDASLNEQAPPFRDLHYKYPVDNLAEALAEGIVSGHPDMPQFVLTPDEIDAFISYLKSLE